MPLKNVTKYTGEVVRLKCEITGSPLPRYTWYKDEDPIEFDDTGRVQARTMAWGSR